MTNDGNSSERSREIERDAKAWSKFSGMKYTQSLRLMEHPLAQGILGGRICARDMIRVLTEHPKLSDSIWETDGGGGEFETNERITHLSDNGLHSAWEHQLSVGSEQDYLAVVLTAEFLRAFTWTPEPQTEAYSYNLKHTAEEFLGEHLSDFSYIANGQAIWAAATLGIPLEESNPGEDSLNADFGLRPEQVDYARRMRGRTGSSSEGVRAHHHRPPGYIFLQQALNRYRETGEAPLRWDGVDEHAEVLSSPFHEWLVAQSSAAGEVAPQGSLERLASDYAAGVRDSDHGVAREPEELLEILHSAGAHPDYIETGRRALVRWARTSSQSTGIRTELMDWSDSSHAGWGAGAGDVERYEYRCPCGAGMILEEHDNVPGFREHDVRIMCDTCRGEWSFVDGLSVRGWRIAPVPASAGAGVAMNLNLSR